MNYRFINPEYIEMVAGGENEVLNEIITMFREQVVEFHIEMKRLFAEKKYMNLGLLAHKAKSSVAIMGMNDLASLLKTFELQAREEIEVDKYESYIARFGLETSEAVKELNDMIESRLKQSL